MFIPNFLLSCIEIKNQLKMNRIFTLFIAVFSVFSIISCSRNSETEEVEVIKNYIPEQHVGTYDVHYVSESGQKSAVPVDTYYITIRRDNVFTWKTQKGTFTETATGSTEGGYPFVFSNKSTRVDLRPIVYRGSDYIEIWIEDKKGLGRGGVYYCTKRR